ncbi:fumarylacetoacetate hydrolase family protein [Mycolicibacterium porcinum]|uniref:Fumarylacetoacetate hydrolase family protein n=1 Tax=Mycolicibacterium porcinum TaxID=39693 RepID=A0AAW5T1G6_9MYCO|nr:fumarylacetoacetate hydrolase family protein [Mycolicibacterium porcinum]MCV7388099.1 fumarylacetoacetate hydrolase family protein [Mycolicibacterium porcinum]ORB43379.1 hydrolase [Mycolicibacterium porcinum]CDO31216.1 fumarylacetoacetate (FAA) hydrolase [Mycolicibacterium vulneris]
MKIARALVDHTPMWGLVDTDRGVVDLIAGPLRAWAPALTADFSSTPPLAGRTVDLESVSLLLPVDPGSKVLAAGATYAKHIAGLGLKMPEKPAAFLKPYESLIGPYDDIIYPPITEQLDYEVELVVVVGAPTRRGDAGAAGILGYCVGNDVSARDLQFGGAVTGMDIFSAKGLDDTSGIGPWIVTRDEIGAGDPDLALTLTVDGEVRQHDRTSSLVWGPAELIEYVAARSRLSPGDVLFTGTPAGVAHEDGRYLQKGQVVEATVEGLGTLRNTVR